MRTGGALAKNIANGSLAGTASEMGNTTNRNTGVDDSTDGDWWEDVSHQAQRVAHVTAASAFAAGGGEVRIFWILDLGS